MVYIESMKQYKKYIVNLEVFGVSGNNTKRSIARFTNLQLRASGMRKTFQKTLLFIIGIEDDEAGQNKKND